MRNDVSIPPEDPRDDSPATSALSHETDALPREAKTAQRQARNTDTHLVNPAEKTHLTHPTMDPALETSARRDDIADVGIYDTPNVMREAGSDLTLSIIVLVLAVAAVLTIFLMWFRK
ncbi:MAG TPA: hypothetical protein VL282_00755 [Tepidisphaeraceae bacterium]|jgi:hypothetical protein|nr:hypothetical protein [Tepidisphaeraceae bacterium]